MSTARKKAVRHAIINSVALTAPAVRMVAVSVSAEADDDGEWRTHVHLYPVLALVAKATDDFGKEVEVDSRGVIKNFPVTAPTFERMQAAGWNYVGDDLVYDAVIFEPELGGLIEAKQALGDVENLVYELALCPWDEADDIGDHLTGLVAELTPRAIEKAKASSTS